MGVWVLWDDQERTILRHVYEGIWTWDEWCVAIAEGHRMMESVDHKVYLIVDAACQAVPPGALSRFRHATSGETEHVKMVILVGNNAFIQTLFGITRKIVRGCAGRFAMVDSLDEAYAIIHQHQMAETHGLWDGR